MESCKPKGSVGTVDVKKIIIEIVAEFGGKLGRNYYICCVS